MDSHDNTKSLPGPWEWKHMGNGDWVLWGAWGSRPIVLDCGNVLGAENFRLRTRDAERDLMIAFDPNHPNSKLLVAAPDLKSAVIKLLSLALGQQLDGPAVQAGMAALYKATGDETYNPTTFAAVGDLCH